LPCIQVRARSEHLLASVSIDTPLLVVPLQGYKRARETDAWVQVMAGELFLIPRPATIDIENIPDPVTGWYSAIGIPLEEHVLSAARQLVREPIRAGRSRITCVPLDAHIEDLTNWLSAVKRGELPRACHSIVGVVLRLYAQGFHDLLHCPPPTVSARIRSMVAANPTHEWSSAALEEQLSVSGATLRRHLAAEGMSLRRVIADARLAQALSLLLTTQLPVKSVAARAGYASVSTFVKRFRERYGVEPSGVVGRL